MLHLLTIGFLDEPAVRRRERVATRPLPAEVLAMLETFLDPGSAPPTIEGRRVDIDDGFVRVVWYVPWLIERAARFALAARHRFGLVVADIEHARVIGGADLAACLRGR